MSIKEVLDNYHSRVIESSRSILLFSDSRYALQGILKGNSQLAQDIIALINRVVAVQRTCNCQWIPAHAKIFGNEQTDDLAKESRNSPLMANFPIALTLPMLIQ
ncbi:hypothetical protein TNCV_294991 [Trichonephila clavipes]|nr:hypothetical protein TNCV_294991 [Trichonephila clavipes]